MIKPLFPLDRFLAGFPERLANCATQGEWNEAVRHLYIHMGSRLLDNREPSSQDTATSDQINKMLKDGLAARKPGRPNADKEGSGYAVLFRMFQVKTIADGVRVLQRTRDMQAALGKQERSTERQVTPDAWRKRAKLAARAGYVFRAKDAPFGKRRTKLTLV